jgi:hypothetical protein
LLQTNHDKPPKVERSLGSNRKDFLLHNRLSKVR